MSHTRLYIAAAIIAVAVILSFVLSVPRTAQGPVVEETPQEEAVAPSVRIERAYEKGVHSISGSVQASNACARVEAAAVTDELEPRIEINLSLVEDEGVCLQVATAIDFSLEVSAPEGAPLSVTLNGAPITPTEL